MCPRRYFLVERTCLRTSEDLGAPRHNVEESVSVDNVAAVRLESLQHAYAALAFADRCVSTDGQASLGIRGPSRELARIRSLICFGQGMRRSLRSRALPSPTITWGMVRHIALPQQCAARPRPQYPLAFSFRILCLLNLRLRRRHRI